MHVNILKPLWGRRSWVSKIVKPLVYTTLPHEIKINIIICYLESGTRYLLFYITLSYMLKGHFDGMIESFKIFATKNYMTTRLTIIIKIKNI